jgi:hypothetical protein
MDFELTHDQKLAVKALERAFRQCKDAKVYIYNDYGTLVAFDGNVVAYVDDKESEYSTEFNFGYCVTHEYNLDSWADDEHFIHLVGK